MEIYVQFQYSIKMQEKVEKKELSLMVSSVKKFNTIRYEAPETYLTLKNLYLEILDY